MWLLVFQRLAIEFLLDFVYFPIWWYTGGVKNALIFCYHLMQNGNSYLAPGLWLKNIFVPMFGQTDFQGRLVSILMRFFNVIGRSIALLFWFIFVFLVFVLWLAFPIFLVIMIIKVF